MIRRKISLKPQARGIDRPLFISVILLVLFGLVMLGNASVVEAQRTFGDQFFYVKQQAVWAGIGFLGLIFFWHFPHQKLKNLALPALLINILLLVLVLIPGLGIAALGARRWLGVGQLVMQPAELIKLSFSLYLASLFSQKVKFLPFILPLLLILGLILLEPDFGTAVVIAGFSGLTFFAAGAPLFYFLVLAPLGLAAAVGLILVSGYRRERLLGFLNPLEDPQGRSYHLRQILIALGSGGLLGTGLGASRQKFLFLPEAATDSIFAIIGEELGFVGAAAVVLTFIFIVFRGLSVARGVLDPFSKILATALTAWIAVQVLVNLGAMVALLPLTGVPLPFLSYGGSSLVVSLSSIGILLNISRDRKIARR